MGRRRDDIMEWLDEIRPYAVLLNLKTQYSIGNMLGKGNFASVYEGIQYTTSKKFAIKTIDKKMIL